MPNDTVTNNYSWRLTGIPELRRLRQEGFPEFHASLGYTMNSKPAWGYTVSSKPVWATEGDHVIWKKEKKKDYLWGRGSQGPAISEDL